VKSEPEAPGSPRPQRRPPTSFSPYSLGANPLCWRTSRVSAVQLSRSWRAPPSPAPPRAASARCTPSSGTARPRPRSWASAAAPMTPPGTCGHEERTKRSSRSCSLSLPDHGGCPQAAKHGQVDRTRPLWISTLSSHDGVKDVKKNQSNGRIMVRAPSLPPQILEGGTAAPLPSGSPHSQVLEPGVHPGGDAFQSHVQTLFLKKRTERHGGQMGGGFRCHCWGAPTLENLSFLARLERFPFFQSQDSALTPGFYNKVLQFCWKSL